MKRFFCQVCQRTIRVRQLPTNVSNGTGYCRHHDSSVSRTSVNDRLRHITTIKRLHVSTPQKPAKNNKRKSAGE